MKYTRIYTETGSNKQQNANLYLFHIAFMVTLLIVIIFLIIIIKINYHVNAQLTLVEITTT